jgi:hypothetical protein
MLKQDKDGYYIVETALDLKQYHRMTDLTMREKIQLRAELNPEKVKVKKSNPKQMDGVKSDEPFVKTRKITKKVDKPEPTEFDKWFN